MKHWTLGQLALLLSKQKLTQKIFTHLRISEISRFLSRYFSRSQSPRATGV